MGETVAHLTTLDVIGVTLPAGITGPVGTSKTQKGTPTTPGLTTPVLLNCSATTTATGIVVVGLPATSSTVAGAPTAASGGTPRTTTTGSPGRPSSLTLGVPEPLSWAGTSPVPRSEKKKRRKNCNCDIFVYLI